MSLAATWDNHLEFERKKFKRPKMPKFDDFEAMWQVLRWSNQWPRIEDDPESVKILFWKARIPDGDN